jgi:hypothetical protein
MMIFYQNLTKKVEKVMKMNSIKKCVNYGYCKNQKIRIFNGDIFFTFFDNFSSKYIKNQQFCSFFGK